MDTCCLLWYSQDMNYIYYGLLEGCRISTHQLLYQSNTNFNRKKMIDEHHQAIRLMIRPRISSNVFANFDIFAMHRNKWRYRQCHFHTWGQPNLVKTEVKNMNVSWHSIASVKGSHKPHSWFKRIQGAFCTYKPFLHNLSCLSSPPKWHWGHRIKHRK